MTKTVFDIRIDLNKSHGSYVYDKKTQKTFLDFFSMFSSLPLGYNHSIFDDSFLKKVSRISHIKMANNLFETDEFLDFKKKFDSISVLKNKHFCSTGALAVESAIKCAYEYKKNRNLKVLSVKNNFHGINSWGFTTDNKMPSVINRTINYPLNDWEHPNIEDVLDYIESNSDKLVAVVIEPIQCTAGDIYLDRKTLIDINKVCNEKDICFICDEIQTGFGVTGSYWYSEKIGLNPDIIVFGKKSQIFGVMTNDKYSEAINSNYRKLEVTFDGDLIDAIRCMYIIAAIEKNDLLNKVRTNSKILFDELSNHFLNYRSTGHLIAFDFTTEDHRNNFVQEVFFDNMLVNPTGEKTVRMRPNLALSDDEIDKAIKVLIKNKI